MLTSLEGKPYATGAEELARCFHAGKIPLSPAQMVTWQAVARHLVTIMDDDELSDLAALEESWGPWALQRLGIPQ